MEIDSFFENPRSMAAFLAILIFLEAFLSGSIAYLPSKSALKKTESYFGYMNCFTSGLFFAMGFNHIFRETNEDYLRLELKEHENQSSLPFSQDYFKHYQVHIFWVCFFLIFSIDNVFLDHHSTGEHHDHGHDNGLMPIKETSLDNLDEALIENPKNRKHKDQSANVLSFKRGSSMRKLSIQIKKQLTEGKNEKETMGLELKKGQHDHTHQNENDSGALLLLVALSIHALISGVAIGIQRQSSNAVNIFLGIAMHKWAEALALSFNLMKTNFSKAKKGIILFFFSTITPLGILIGMFVGGLDKRMDIVLMCASSSTFFYMSVVEIMADEFSKRKQSGWKFLCFLLGGAMIQILTSLYD